MAGMTVQVVGNVAVVEQTDGPGRVIIDPDRVLVFEDRASAPGTTTWTLPKSFAATASEMISAGLAALASGSNTPSS
jgi:hypothetical protein